MGGFGVEDTTMGADPRALLGALLRLRTLEGAVDMDTLLGFFPLPSGSEEGKYPESLLDEESTSLVGKVVCPVVGTASG